MKYIDKILSQLKGYKRTDEIKYELFDHLDEHERFFKEIGYDEEKATEKAEELMGDADVVAEQFKVVEKKNNLVLAIVNIAILLSIPECFLASIFPTSYFGLFDLFALIPALIMFVLFSIDVFLSIKHKSIWGMIFSMIAGLSICISFSAGTGNAFSVLNDHNPIRTIFEYSRVVFDIICVIFLVAQISTILIKAKTTLQRNRKFDLKFLNAMKIIVAIVSVATIVASSCVLPQLVINIDEVRSEINEANQIVVENISSLEGCDYEGAKAWIEENFSDYQIDTLDKADWNGATMYDEDEVSCSYYSPNNHISITVFCDKESVNLYVTNECNYYSSDPDYDLNFFKPEDIFYFQNAAKNKVNAKDMDLPYGLTVSYSKNSNEIDIRTYCDEGNCDSYLIWFEYKNGEIITNEFKHLEI